MKSINVEISVKSVALVLGLLILAYVSFLIVDIILLLFVAVLLAAAASPTVEKLSEKGVPRGMSIILLYFLLIVGSILSLMILIPPLVQQAANLTQALNGKTSFISYFSESLASADIHAIVSNLDSVPQILSPISSLFSALVYMTTLAVMTFYLLNQRHSLHEHLHFLFHNKKAEDDAETFINNLEKEIGGWVRGQGILMGIVGVLTYVGLLLLGIPYALPLAIIAGLLEVLPNIGPTFSAVPALLIALTTSPLSVVIGVLALYIAVQQLENNLIVPLVMKHSVGINPIITIVVLLIGLRLFGLLGGILGIPIYIVLKATYQQYTKFA